MTLMMFASLSVEIETRPYRQLNLDHFHHSTGIFIPDLLSPCPSACPGERAHIGSAQIPNLCLTQDPALTSVEWGSPDWA